ncbi:MAG: signal peptide peptidase SppA [Planctomycetota bacterium]
MRTPIKLTAIALSMVMALQAAAIAYAKDSSSKKPARSDAAAEEKKAEPKKVRLAHISIEGAMPESPGQMSLFGDLGVDLRKQVARIDKAAGDKNIAGIILEIKPSAIGWGKLNELREAVARAQSAGKKVYGVAEMAMAPQYLLAVACDEVVMPESGMILIPGLHGEFAYYKDMLAKLGLEADIMHVGEAKGAGEPYTRDSMSEGVKKNMTALIDDLYDQMITTIAKDREMKVDEAKAAIDQGLLTAIAAKELGLVDRLVYPDVFRAQLKEEYAADKLVYVVNYGKKKVDTDFSGPMGMMKLFQSILGASRGGRGAKGPKVALVYAVGPIMSGKSQSDPFAGEVMGSDTIVKALQEAAADEAVKAIVLRINSPGGSALASDMIWRATQAIDKPIVASMGDVAGSGGYYIAMGADKIMAEPGTITGSIGVVGGKIAMGGLYDKIGMNTETISRGANSGIFSATEKFSDSEKKVFEKFLKDIYLQFTSKAAEGRGMELEELEKHAGGQVYTGRVAKRLGLVDELGSLKDALNLAKQLAGIDADEKAQLKVLPKPENPFEAIFKADLDAEREAHVMAALSGVAPELKTVFSHAAHLHRTLLQEPALLMMPYTVQIK